MTRHLYNRQHKQTLYKPTQTSQRTTKTQITHKEISKKTDEPRKPIQHHEPIQKNKKQPTQSKHFKENVEINCWEKCLEQFGEEFCMNAGEQRVGCVIC